ncbi:MAG: uroporphyrinogen-III synthase [Rhodobacteraceae bacterium]|nr:MAG: uroporphyrinogen-III synthase [Paracoccaceae bacterium]
MAPAADAPAILVTRPEPEGARLAERLAADGWRPLIWPVLSVAGTGAAPDYAGAQAAVLTSANAARHAPPGPIPAYCVGDATAAAAQAAGFPQAISAAGDATALMALLRARLRPEGGRVVVLRGETVAADVAAALRAEGFDARETVVYATRASDQPPGCVARALAAGDLRAAAFYSPRSAAVFADWARRARPPLGHARALAISAAAAAPLQGLGFEGVTVAAHPDGEAMLAGVAALRAAV